MARDGFFPHYAAYWAQASPRVGVIIDGGVRDVDALASAQFPVFSRGVSVHRTSKHAPGLIGQPIVFAGVLVAPSDTVVADADSVVVVRAARVADVVAKARERAAKEERIMTALTDGGRTADLYHLPTRG